MFTNIPVRVAERGLYMCPLPTIFDACIPRPEVLAGELPDAIFAADLLEVVENRAHQDYQDPVKFFGNSYPTESLKVLIKDVAERLAGVQGTTPVFRLETGFGGGKTSKKSCTAC